MKFRGKAIGFGILVWLIPFIVSFLIFPFHDTARPLFESIMAVTVCATAVCFGILYLRGVEKRITGEGIRVGLLWLLISVLIDAPLMLLGGPMKMSVGDYMADIGVTYLCIPVIVWGLSVTATRSSNKTNAADQADN